jgi:hypothetical protein
VYAWGQTDPADSVGNAMDVRAVGVQTLPGELGGLPAAARLLRFAINTHGRWSNPSQNEFDIAVDVTGSPAPDYFVVGVDIGAVLAGAFDGRFGSFVLNASGDIVDVFFAEAPMNGSTVLLPVAASSLGMAEGAHNKLRYSATGFSVLGPQFDVVAGNPRFPPWAPTSSQGDFIPLGPGASAPLTLTSSASAKSDGTLGWLVVALDDANGAAQANQIALPTKP